MASPRCSPVSRRRRSCRRPSPSAGVSSSRASAPTACCSSSRTSRPSPTSASTASSAACASRARAPSRSTARCSRSASGAPPPASSSLGLCTHAAAHAPPRRRRAAARRRRHRHRRRRAGDAGAHRGQRRRRRCAIGGPQRGAERAARRRPRRRRAASLLLEHSCVAARAARGDGARARRSEPLPGAAARGTHSAHARADGLLACVGSRSMSALAQLHNAGGRAQGVGVEPGRARRSRAWRARAIAGGDRPRGRASPTRRARARERRALDMRPRRGGARVSQRHAMIDAVCAARTAASASSGHERALAQTPWRRHLRRPCRRERGHEASRDDAREPWVRGELAHSPRVGRRSNPTTSGEEASPPPRRSELPRQVHHVARRGEAAPRRGRRRSALARGALVRHGGVATSDRVWHRRATGAARARASGCTSRAASLVAASRRAASRERLAVEGSRARPRHARLAMRERRLQRRVVGAGRQRISAGARAAGGARTAQTPWRRPLRRPPATGARRAPAPPAAAASRRPRRGRGAG